MQFLPFSHPPYPSHSSYSPSPINPPPLFSTKAYRLANGSFRVYDPISLTLRASTRHPFLFPSPPPRRRGGRGRGGPHLGRISSVPPERDRRLSLSPRGTSGERAGERGPFIPSMFYRVSPLSSGWWYRQNAPRSLAERGHSCPQQCLSPVMGRKSAPRSPSWPAADRNIRAPR